jgi:hypothetical protein
VVLVDRDRRIRYAGRIDDRYKIRGVMTPGDAEPELANAIQDLLAGREIREPRTKAAGCPLDRPERPVARRLPRPPSTRRRSSRTSSPSCTPSARSATARHQAGPFNLLTYDDAVEWVELGPRGDRRPKRMPPAQIESDL